MPALLTRMSSRPSSRPTRATMAATADGSVTSATTDNALTPSLVRSADRGHRFRLVAAYDRDLGAGFRKPARHAKPDAAVAAGDDGYLAGEIEGSDFMADIPDVWLALAQQDQDQPDGASAAPYSAHCSWLIMKLDCGQWITPVPWPIQSRPMASAIKPMIRSDGPWFSLVRVGCAAIAQRPPEWRACCCRARARMTLRAQHRTRPAQGTKKPRTMPGLLIVQMDQISTLDQYLATTGPLQLKR